MSMRAVRYDGRHPLGCVAKRANAHSACCSARSRPSSEAGGEQAIAHHRWVRSRNAPHRPSREPYRRSEASAKLDNDSLHAPHPRFHESKQIPSSSGNKVSILPVLRGSVTPLGNLPCFGCGSPGASRAGGKAGRSLGVGLDADWRARLARLSERPIDDSRVASADSARKSSCAVMLRL
ncbi:hypothetical protein EJ06DRAFT_393846 [Trichodelitschia bisporula]|uniref:Uncharacterized protein n=1 Tax=Trichodelitschia bisporula TaxID=703511 RepID=A0A6G1I080_9PEZI|nr:hypothetical protein EJ06DRAFT_393846 [Trichodelitschia bisporula]